MLEKTNTMPLKIMGRKQSTAVAFSGKLAVKLKGQFLRKIDSNDPTDDLENGDSENEAISELQVKSVKCNLTEAMRAELEQEINIFLTTEDPNVSNDMVTFNYQEREYAPLENLDHLAIHYEARNKVVCKKPEMELVVPEALVEEDDTLEPPTVPVAEAEKLCNQFNFSERSTQTPVRMVKCKNVQTEPPAKVNFSASVTQWEMYDYYQKDAEKQAIKENAKENDKQIVDVVTEEVKYADLSRFKVIKMKPDLTVLMNALRVTERMINQNTYDEITQDFKYWEDLSDDLKGSSGSLLPLWKFLYENTHDLAVTGLRWNPKYEDMFVASYGSYSFMQQKAGFICAFSLSNPSHPEAAFATTSGAMCVDVHPDYCHYLAVGLYDGNVAVFSLESSTRKPLCQSDSWNGKHLEPIWQVQWQNDDLDGNMNFFSIGGDGKMIKWTLIKGSHLRASDVLKVRLRDSVYEELNLPSGICHVGATAFHFHPTWAPVFLLGSDEGRIFRCNKTHSQGMLMEYEPHDHAVYAIQWNEFHPRIFITGSFDHTIKIWEHLLNEPVFTFYLGSPVSDVKWAPYSATVFAAVTTDGKVYVYDLSMNKYSPICVQVIVPKKNIRLTSIAFSPTFPVILVGDSRGCIRCMKLSPNLRKSMQGEEIEKRRDQEVASLDKCLSVFKGP